MGTRFKPRPAGCEPTPRQVRKAALLVCWSCQSRIPQTEGLKPDIYFLSTLEAASLIKVSATLFFSRPFSVACTWLQTVLWSLCTPLGSLCMFRFPFLYLFKKNYVFI